MFCRIFMSLQRCNVKSTHWILDIFVVGKETDASGADLIFSSDQHLPQKRAVILCSCADRHRRRPTTQSGEIGDCGISYPQLIEP